jgi:hypothetical protein
MFKLQEETETKIYNIVNYDYNITIQLTTHLVKIRFDDQSIYITVPRIWDGHKRYIITNETTDRTTVLHQVVFTNQLAMYNHFIEAMQHIIHKFSSHHLLYILKTILSLRNYPILTRKFHHIWENPLFTTKYKLLKYKIKQHNTIEKLKKYEAESTFQQSRINILEAEFQQLSDNKRCIDI